MTSYNSCCYPGCTERIPYDPKCSTNPSKYCKEHDKHMTKRSAIQKDSLGWG